MKLRGVVAGALLAVLAACAGAPPPRPVLAELPTTAAWFSRAVDPSKDVVVRADLRALRASSGLASSVEEALLSVVGRALERGPNLREALTSASEAVVAVLPDGEPLLLFRDVSATLDPASLRALDGGAQWELRKASWSGVVEYNYHPASGSLFVLADGTWVLGAGTAAQRAKNAFTEAGGAPILPVRSARSALELHVPGAALERIARERRAQRLEAVLVPALELSVVLEGGNVAVATLLYPDAARAIEAERVLRDAAEAFGRRGRSLAWLGTAKITRNEASLVARVDVPLTAFGDLSGADRW